MTTVELNDRELATVLAGLRFLQREMLDGTSRRLTELFSDHFVNHPPLPPSGIDDLCMKINLPHLKRKPR